MGFGVSAFMNRFVIGPLPSLISGSCQPCHVSAVFWRRDVPIALIVFAILNLDEYDTLLWDSIQLLTFPCPKSEE